jgi:MFS family permease
MRLVRRTIQLYREAFAGLPREVWLVALAGLVTRAGTMVLPFLALYVREHLGFAPLQVGFLVGLYGVGSMAGSVVGGWLSDRIDPNRVQQLALTGGGVGLLVLPLIDGFWPMAGAVLAVATVAEAFRPALMVAVAHYSRPSVRTRSFALVRLAVNLGMAIGPAVGGVLASVDYHWLFAADAVTCWAAAILLAVTLGSVPASLPPPTGGDGARPRSAFSDREYLAFLSLVMILGMVFLQAWSTLPLAFKQDFGLSERAIGGLLALNALLIVLLEMVLMRAVEGFDHGRIVGLGALLVCGGMAILGLGTSAVIATLSVVTWTFGEMLCLPMTNAIAADRAGGAATGSYMGALTLAFSISFVGAPVIGTAVYDHFGPQTLWLAIGAAGPLLWLAFTALAPRLRRSARSPEPPNRGISI